jgi:hypothetical protein
MMVAMDLMHPVLLRVVEAAVLLLLVRMVPLQVVVTAALEHRRQSLGHQ